MVLVFVDRLDLASARAIQYARTLTPDELRAVHFVIDDEAAQHLAEEWGRLGLHRVSLELVECPDRRLTRSAVETIAHELADGETEVSVLLPDRKYRGVWHRILHDRTADSIQEEVSRLPHANVTAVPFHFDSIDDSRVPLSVIVGGDGAGGAGGNGAGALVPRPEAAARRARCRCLCVPWAATAPTGPAATRSPDAHRSRRCATATVCAWVVGSGPCGSHPSTMPPCWSWCWTTAAPPSR